MRGILEKNGNRIKKTAFFCAEAGACSDKAFSQLSEPCRLDSVATCVVKEHELKHPDYFTEAPLFPKRGSRQRSVNRFHSRRHAAIPWHHLNQPNLFGEAPCPNLETVTIDETPYFFEELTQNRAIAMTLQWILLTQKRVKIHVPTEGI